jgi:hypothetical protein
LNIVSAAGQMGSNCGSRTRFVLTCNRPPNGRQLGEARRIEIEVWCLQAIPGLEPSEHLVTFEIVHDETGHWCIRKQT